MARVNARYGSGEEYDGVPEPKRCNCRVCLYFGQEFEVENDSDEDEVCGGGIVTDTDINPNPQAWPICSECRMPFVLRRMMQLQTHELSSGKTTNSLECIWGWQRDCKHKNSAAEVAGPLMEQEL